MNRLNLVFKAAVVGFLTLLLLIPLGMINGTIAERQRYRADAVSSVAQSFSGAQTLAGPVLVLPYVDAITVISKDKDGKELATIEKTARRQVFFPEHIDLRGQLKPDIRKRGLHEVRVYELQSLLTADFRVLMPAETGVVRTLGRPYLSLSLADVRGLVGSPTLKVNRQLVALQQGAGGHREDSGLHALLPLVTLAQVMPLQVELALNLAGTESLAITPIADSNRIRISSSWPHPQFAGRFLPRTRRIDDQGFDAVWEISSLAAGSQQQYQQGAAMTAIDSLNVSLVEPVNIYTQADRASKYGILFVVLTFAGFFMFELIKRLAIHPIQYLLVGLALAIFFLLLLSLSEHIEFYLAYLIASVACIGLLGVYLSAVLKSRRRGLAFAAMLTLLYTALYGLLVSEDNALVLGSLLLFAILAAIMLITRKIDWYALGQATQPPLPVQ